MQYTYVNMPGKGRGRAEVCRVMTNPFLFGNDGLHGSPEERRAADKLQKAGLRLIAGAPPQEDKFCYMECCSTRDRLAEAMWESPAWREKMKRAKEPAELARLALDYLGSKDLPEEFNVAERLERARDRSKKSLKEGDMAGCTVRQDINKLLRHCVYPEDTDCPVEKQFLPILLLKRAEDILLREKMTGRPDLKAALQDLELLEAWKDEGLPGTLKYKLYFLKNVCLTKLKRYKEAESVAKKALTLISYDANCDTNKEMLMMKEKLNKSLKVVKSFGGMEPSFEHEEQNTIPKITSPNPKLPFLSDALELQGCSSNTPSETRCFPVTARNFRKLIATRDVKPGEVLAVLQPSAVMSLLDRPMLHCHSCTSLMTAPMPCPGCSSVMFCSLKCRDQATSKQGHHNPNVCGMGAEGFLGWPGAYHEHMVRLVLGLVTTKEFHYYIDNKKEFNYLGEACQGTSGPGLASKLEDGLLDLTDVGCLLQLEDVGKKWTLDPKTFSIPADTGVKLASAALAFKLADFSGYIPKGAPREDRDAFLKMLLQLTVAVSSNSPHMHVLDPAKDKDSFPVWGGGECTCCMHEESTVHIGQGLFAADALFRASCVPNTGSFQVGLTKVVLATRAISRGEAVTQNLVNVDIKRHNRRQKEDLILGWAGQNGCDCPACNLDSGRLNKVLEKAETVSAKDVKALAAQPDQSPDALEARILQLEAERRMRTFKGRRAEYRLWAAHVCGRGLVGLAGRRAAEGDRARGVPAVVTGDQGEDNVYFSLKDPNA